MRRELGSCRPRLRLGCHTYLCFAKFDHKYLAFYIRHLVKSNFLLQYHQTRIWWYPFGKIFAYMTSCLRSLNSPFQIIIPLRTDSMAAPWNLSLAWYFELPSSMVFRRSGGRNIRKNVPRAKAIRDVGTPSPLCISAMTVSCRSKKCQSPKGQRELIVAVSVAFIEKVSSALI
jgi:hypothetical protein